MYYLYYSVLYFYGLTYSYYIVYFIIHYLLNSLYYAIQTNLNEEIFSFLLEFLKLHVDNRSKPCFQSPHIPSLKSAVRLEGKQFALKFSH